ncbi:MAG: TadE/TadG family type IV pilus assembly protein [Gemmobacter sp.]|jgi:uncharacterized membrane protein|nr:TadE/TadG family type IV pilus assembly protein [Gemmobacter sp.]
MSRITRSVRRLLKSEDGSATFEAVLWLPVFTFVLALVVDTALIYSSQARALRVVQDANRMMALGRFANVGQAEDFIRTSLSPMSARAIVQTRIVNGVIISRVELPAADLTATKMLSGFSSLRVGVSAQHVSEV